MHQGVYKINPEHIYASSNFFYNMMTTGTFFHGFSIFSTMPYIALEVISCIINAHCCAFCASICIVVSFYSNFWYVHSRHSCLMIYEIFAFFQKFFNFGKIEQKNFVSRIALMLIIYKILLQNFSLRLFLLICNEILIYKMI